MENINIGDYVRYITKTGVEIHKVVRFFGKIPVLDNGFICSTDNVEVIKVDEAFTDELQKLLQKYGAEVKFGVVDITINGETFSINTLKQNKVYY